jgi:hypothetical protein
VAMVPGDEALVRVRARRAGPREGLHLGPQAGRRTAS